MKKNIHPEYREVLYVDSSTGTRFTCGSTQKTDKTEVYKGKEYPVYPVSISSSSHPFFTGSSKLVDSEGRVDKFTKRYANKNAQLKQQSEIAEEAPKKTSKKTSK